MSKDQLKDTKSQSVITENIVSTVQLTDQSRFYAVIKQILCSL